MELITLKQFAVDHKISYEAVRKQVIRYAGTKFLDEVAVKFLEEKRRQSPIILINEEATEEAENLRAQVEVLKNKLLEAQENIIKLQEESKKAIESQVKYDALLEQSQEKDRQLKESGEEIGRIRQESDQLKEQIETIKKERDEAQTEAQSFKKSIFGFYRKI